MATGVYDEEEWTIRSAVRVGAGVVLLVVIGVLCVAVAVLFGRSRRRQGIA